MSSMLYTCMCVIAYAQLICSTLAVNNFGKNKFLNIIFLNGRKLLLKFYLTKLSCKGSCSNRNYSIIFLVVKTQKYRDVFAQLIRIRTEVT